SPTSTTFPYTPLFRSRLADELAALSRWASLPFATLLDELGRRLPPSTSILALTAEAQNDVLPVLRRMMAGGRQVRLMALGPDARSEEHTSELQSLAYL